MEKREIVLKKFIEKWETKQEVVGAIVCGSYITGNPSKHSDIDVHIILDSKTSWRERGNEIIDGILIEYFANPARMHQRYAKEDYQQRQKINAHMFSTGKVLFDRTGELAQIIQDSKKQLVREFSKPSNIENELSKYFIWDMCDNLEEVFESDGDDFIFVFHNELKRLFDSYSKYLQFDNIPPNKLIRFLRNEKDKKKYHIKDYPDINFVDFFIKTINLKQKPKMMEEYKKLTNYVLEKMGGFTIDGWKLRTPAE